MYLDKNLKIDFPIPTLLQEVLVQIDAAYTRGDDIEFAYLRDDLEITAKQALRAGKITRDQFDWIMKRYGLL